MAPAGGLYVSRTVRRVVRIRIETDNSCITHDGTGYALPRQQAISDVPCDLGAPLDREAGGCSGNPIRLPVALIPDFAEVRHKTWKILVMRPEFEHALYRSRNRDGLLDVNGAPPGEPDQALKFDIGDAAEEHAKTDN